MLLDSGDLYVGQFNERALFHGNGKPLSKKRTAAASHPPGINKEWQRHRIRYMRASGRTENHVEKESLQTQTGMCMKGNLGMVIPTGKVGRSGEAATRMMGNLNTECVRERAPNSGQSQETFMKETGRTIFLMEKDRFTFHLHHPRPRQVGIALLCPLR